MLLLFQAQCRYPAYPVKNKKLKSTPPFAPPAGLPSLPQRILTNNRKHLPFQREFRQSVLLSRPEMQFRFSTELTAEEYVRTEAWKHVRVVRCLIHPDSYCRFSRHGTYPREIPKGTKIVRILCHTEQITFSLLPDCFSSRLPGTLADIEKVVLMVETFARDSECELTPEAAGKILSSPDLATLAEKSGVDGRLFDRAVDFRWMKRRMEYVLAILSVVACLFPEKFKNCRPSLISLRSVLGGGPVLVRLRELAESRSHEIPFPVGLNPRFSRPQDMVRRPP